MKRLLVSVLALLPFATLADIKPSEPSQFERISGRWGAGFDVSHYCHLGAVYAVLFTPGRERRVVSSTLVWDMENNRPYECDEFEQRQDRLMEDYEKEMEEYYEEYPRDKLRPNRHVRP